MMYIMLIPTRLEVAVLLHASDLPFTALLETIYPSGSAPRA